jgi:hypothetical protein
MAERRLYRPNRRLLCIGGERETSIVSGTAKLGCQNRISKMARHSLLSLRTSMLVRVVKTSILPGSIGTTYPEREYGKHPCWNDQAQMRRQSYIGSCCMLDPCMWYRKNDFPPPWTAKSTADAAYRCTSAAVRGALELHQIKQDEFRLPPGETTGCRVRQHPRGDPRAHGAKCVGAFCTTV